MAEGTRVGFHKGIVGEHSLSGYGPLSSVKRPVRTRMRGVVGRGREKLPLTRFEDTPEMYILLELIIGKRVPFRRDNPNRPGILIPRINKTLLQLRLLGG